MKSQAVLSAVALLATVVDCLPQVFSYGNVPTTTIPIFGGGGFGGDSQTITINGVTITIPLGLSMSNIGGPTTVIQFSTEIISNNHGRTTSTRSSRTSTSVVPPPQSTSTSSVRTTSTHVPPPPPTSTSSKSTSTYVPPPPTTSKSTSTYVPPPPTSTSTSKSTPPPPTTTSKPSTTSQAPPPPTTTSKSTSTTFITTTKAPTKSTTAAPTTTQPPAKTNPYSAACPVPSTYTIKNFKSTDGDAGRASMMVTYGAGTFTCPNVDSHAYYNPSSGIYQLNCDNDQLLIVETDGFSWIYVQETFWCPSGPQGTLQTTSNSTTLDSILDCQTNGQGVTTCTQEPAAFTIPVQNYDTNGFIGYAPADVNGSPLPQCPRIPNQGPIVTNTAGCTGSGVTSTLGGGVSGTVSVNQPSATAK